MAERLSWFAPWWPALLPLAVSLPLLLFRLDSYPAIWFDEGYRTNAARTLAERGVYGTYSTTGYIPYDPGISNGPADMIPLAFSFKVFGSSVWSARIVFVLFTILALFGLHGLAVDLYGRTAGLFIMLVILAAPTVQGVSLLLIGRQVLSETPGLALTVAGLWLWLWSWRTGHAWAGPLAGLAMGLGLLSKTQMAITLVPAMGIVSLAQLVKERSARWLVPVGAALAVVAGWELWTRFATPALIRQDNSRLLLDAIRSNLITGLWGSQLSFEAKLAAGGMALIGLLCAWRLWRDRGHDLPGRRQARWLEAGLVLFLLGTMVWFALFSVGWIRYAYAGIIVGLFLFGRLAWGALLQARRWLRPRWPAAARATYPAALGVLSVAAVFVNLYPLVRTAPSTDAQQMGDYIHGNIPPQAVIESWEWEVDALSGHWQFHHPDQSYLFLAIRQVSRGQTPFDLRYDGLQTAPEYLLIGPFARWTEIYDAAVISNHYAEVTTIGVYTLYRRRQVNAQ